MLGKFLELVAPRSGYHNLTTPENVHGERNLKIYHPKRKGSSSNHNFSGVNSLFNFGSVAFFFQELFPLHFPSASPARPELQVDPPVKPPAEAVPGQRSSDAGWKHKHEKWGDAWGTTKQKTHEVFSYLFFKSKHIDTRRLADRVMIFSLFP